MEDVVIITRDINGERTNHYMLWDQAYTYIEEHLTDEDEILLVMVEDSCIYSGLLNDPISREELTGFFA